MDPVARQLEERYHQYFIRKYKYRYWLVVVDNHFEDIYSIFLYTQKIRTSLQRSYELVHFNREPQKYEEIMQLLHSFSNLSIEYRDTRHLIHPGTDITYDTAHGHSANTHYSLGNN